MGRTRGLILRRWKKFTTFLRKTPPNGHPIYLDYPIHPRPRYGYGLPPHPRLNAIVATQRATYEAQLRGFLAYRETYARIPVTRSSPQSTEPAWDTGWFPSLDIISLYGLLANRNPKRYVEVGSGNSTTVARRAIQDQELRTRITSIDPRPRAEIDEICDRVIRQPVEDVPLNVFEELEEGDFLLVDNSHRVFQNSDATVCFLDVLPMLPPGVTVAFHDIFLPYDYSEKFGAHRYYSEQYLLAAYLLAEGPKIRVLLPNAYVTHDPDLLSILTPIWDCPALSSLKREGCLFWLQTN